MSETDKKKLNLSQKLIKPCWMTKIFNYLIQFLIANRDDVCNFEYRETQMYMLMCESYF